MSSQFIILGTRCQTCGGLVAWISEGIYGFGNERIGCRSYMRCEDCRRHVDPDGLSAMSSEWEATHTRRGNLRRVRRTAVTK
jgi:hypothetical protein